MVKSNFDFEEIYAMRLMAFEKEQAKKGLRPPLPCTQRRKMYEPAEGLCPAAVAQRAERKIVRRQMYESILGAMGEGEVIGNPVIAERVDKTPAQISNYLISLVEEGYIHKISMTHKQNTYAYIKSGKAMEDE